MFGSTRNQHSSLPRTWFALIALLMGVVSTADQAFSAGEAGEEIRTRITVAVGQDFEPLLFLNAQGQPAGLYVDIWRLWSKKTGIEVELKTMDWSQTIPALQVNLGLACLNASRAGS